MWIFLKEISPAYFYLVPMPVFSTENMSDIKYIILYFWIFHTMYGIYKHKQTQE